MVVRGISERSEGRRVVLFPVAHAGVPEALALIEDGDWSAGRAALASVVEDVEAEPLAAPEHARILYNFGQALRFDEDLGIERFSQADDAFALALALEQNELFETARRRSTQHREYAITRHRRQELAMEYADLDSERMLAVPGAYVSTGTTSDELTHPRCGSLPPGS